MRLLLTNKKKKSRSFVYHLFHILCCFLYYTILSFKFIFTIWLSTIFYQVISWIHLYTGWYLNQVPDKKKETKFILVTLVTKSTAAELGVMFIRNTNAANCRNLNAIIAATNRIISAIWRDICGHVFFTVVFSKIFLIKMIETWKKYDGGV